jgi:hypothetical protein
MEPANGGSGLLISSRERLDLPRETEGLPNCLQRLQSSAWHIWVMIGKSGKMSFSEVTLVASYSVVAERNRDPEQYPRQASVFRSRLFGVWNLQTFRPLLF